MGANTATAALAATAASMALPPWARIMAPICEASGCSVATTPWRVMTIERACERSAASLRAKERVARARLRKMGLGFMTARSAEGPERFECGGCWRRAKPLEGAELAPAFARPGQCESASKLLLLKRIFLRLFAPHGGFDLSNPVRGGLSIGEPRATTLLFVFQRRGGRATQPAGRARAAEKPKEGRGWLRSCYKQATPNGVPADMAIGIKHCTRLRPGGP